MSATPQKEKRIFPVVCVVAAVVLLLSGHGETVGIGALAIFVLFLLGAS